MKVIVTGATGFVGRHVVRKLLGRGHDVCAIARNEPSLQMVDWVDEVEFLRLDVSRASDIAIARLGKLDAIAHLAWPGLPRFRDLSHLERHLPDQYTFLRRLIDAGVRQVLVAGTCLEYGLQNGALEEASPTMPVTPYGVAKDALRRFLECLRAQLPFSLQWARLFYIYGPGQAEHSLLARLDRVIDDGGSTFDMTMGEQLRDYLPVEEVANQLVKLVENPQCSGTLNVCSGVPISVRQLVENHVAARKARIRLNFGAVPYPDYEPLAFWGKPGKLASL